VAAATVNWVTQASFAPQLVVVGVKTDSHAHALIKESKAFALNVLGRGQQAMAFTFFKPATREGQTISGEPFRSGSTGAPILERTPAFVECRLVDSVERGDHSVFVGEVVVEIGARTRTIPPALRRVLQHRDGGCRFPGCGVRVGQGHHLRHWAQGGPTTLSNLALLCRRHHRAVHEEGYQVAREPDGSLQFRRPDGRAVPAVPAPAAVPADPVQALRQQHEAHDLRLTARTGCPSWLGERLDVGWAIDVLHPRAGRLA
jgi:flavin reductase (DIM6/NTAB) family NADH-FMN oxidoreductase RutF